MNCINRLAIYLFVSLVAGCATSKVDIDPTTDYVEQIDNGLYFIREGADGRIFESGETVQLNWEKKATEQCNGSNFETLVYQDFHHRHMFSESQRYFLPPLYLWYKSSPKPVINSVVHCEGSSLTTDQAVQKLKDDYYILPES